MTTRDRRVSPRWLLAATLVLSIPGCDEHPAAPDASAGDARPDAPPAVDAGPCTPGAASLVCADATTLSLCTDDPNFDGTADGPPVTLQISCEGFFRNAGAATCETYDGTSAEAICTMDDGGPCGVYLVTGHVSTARCTTDDAVCLLNLAAKNYLCTSGTGIACPATGAAFQPFCDHDLLVWRCGDDGDGHGQPYVDDCAALGQGTCDAAARKCIGIHQGGRCNATEWICGQGLQCRNEVCVPL